MFHQKKASIIEERKQEQYDSLLKKWRKETDIKVDKKVWKKVDFEETGFFSLAIIKGLLMIKYFTIEDLLKHYLQKKFHILYKTASL